MKTKTYHQIAQEDYETARFLLDGNRLNPSIEYIQQFVEKSFKEIIVRKGDSESDEDKLLLGSHNLSRLAQRVEKLMEVKFSKEENLYLRALRNVYFSTSCPGDSYEDIDKETATDMFEWCTEFKVKVDVLIDKAVQQQQLKPSNIFNGGI